MDTDDLLVGFFFPACGDFPQDERAVVVRQDLEGKHHGVTAFARRQVLYPDEGIVSQVFYPVNKWLRMVRPVYFYLVARKLIIPVFRIKISLDPYRHLRTN